MSSINKKRSVKKNDKRSSRLRTKLYDEKVEILDAEIRMNKIVLNLVKRAHSYNSIYNRSNKMEKNNNVIKWNESITKRFLQYIDPIAIFPSDDLPPSQHVLLPVPKPPSSTKCIPVMHQTSMQQIRSNSNARVLPTPTTNEFDQQYRSKFVFNKIHKPTFDLLPSPSMFSIHISGVNEGSKFLQELALDRIKNINKYLLESNVSNSPPKHRGIIKTCLNCQSDISSYFTPIDAKKLKFYCEKCMDKRRRQEASNIDLLHLYNSRPSGTTITTLNYSMTIPDNSSYVSLKPSMHPSTSTLNSRPSPSINTLSQKQINVRPSQDPISLQPRLIMTTNSSTPPANIPRLIIHQSSGVKLQELPRRPNINKNIMNPSYNLPQTSGPIMPHGAMIRPPPTSAIPIYLPVSHFKISPKDGIRQQFNVSTQSHNQGGRDQRPPMLQTPVLREKLPNSNSPRTIFSTRLPNSTPGLRFVSSTTENNDHRPSQIPGPSKAL